MPTIGTSPKTEAKTPVWERCLSIPGLHGKVPRYLDISISYQDLDGKAVCHDAHSSWAALLQHERDHPSTASSTRCA